MVRGPAGSGRRRGRRHATWPRCRHGRRVPGGILIRGAAAYDTLSRFLLGPFVGRIAADVAAVAPARARVLEVGCGPGHLSIRLARRHGLEVTGLDLDPAMIARANADRLGDGDERRPSFLVGDVASLAFPDGAFDLVVSTLSMHHWADPTAGLAEIGRVLRPGGRALVWDFRPGARPHPFGPRHAHIPDPVDHMRSSRLQAVNARPWRWPRRFTLTQRIELVQVPGRDRQGDRHGQADPGRAGRGGTEPGAAAPLAPRATAARRARRPLSRRRDQRLKDCEAKLADYTQRVFQAVGGQRMASRSRLSA
jgi:SAM-dependent methyltransferase